MYRRLGIPFKLNYTTCMINATQKQRKETGNSELTLKLRLCSRTLVTHSQLDVNVSLHPRSDWFLPCSAARLGIVPLPPSSLIRLNLLRFELRNMNNSGAGKQKCQLSIIPMLFVRWGCALDDLWIWTQSKNRKVDPWIFPIFFFLLLREQHIFPNPSFCVLFRLKLRDQRERSFLFFISSCCFFFSILETLVCLLKRRKYTCFCWLFWPLFVLVKLLFFIFFPPGVACVRFFAISAVKLYCWNFLTARVEQLLDLNVGLDYDKSRLRLKLTFNDLTKQLCQHPFHLKGNTLKSSGVVITCNDIAMYGRLRNRTI